VLNKQIRDYNCFAEVTFFVMLKVSKLEQRAAISSCVKLRLLKRLKHANSEEYLSRTSVSERHKWFESD
jgi:hypothetical protein